LGGPIRATEDRSNARIWADRLTVRRWAGIAYNVQLDHDLRDANNTAYSQAFWLLMSCMVAALVVSGGLGLQLYGLITSGLNSIEPTLQHVSQSLDLTHAAKVERMDEIGCTATAFNALLACVAEVVGEVRGWPVWSALPPDKSPPATSIFPRARNSKQPRSKKRRPACRS
jgi:methyl-accepting chemotaxis protein